jgi:hypothetical protein
LLYNSYDKGNLVRVSVTFKTPTGTPVDPSVVVCQVEDPLGTTTTNTYTTIGGSIAKTGTGAYYYDVDGDMTGIWKYRWYSTGTGQSADESLFEINESEF